MVKFEFRGEMTTSIKYKFNQLIQLFSFTVIKNKMPKVITPVVTLVLVAFIITVHGAYGPLTLLETQAFISLTRCSILPTKKGDCGAFESSRGSTV